MISRTNKKAIVLLLGFCFGFLNLSQAEEKCRAVFEGEASHREENSPNNYFQYLSQTKKQFPPLSQDENTALILEFKRTGNIKIRNKIVSHNLGLVTKTIQTYQWAVSPVIDRMDLIQVGNEALIKALSAYEPALNYQFSSFAVSYIKGYIKTFILEQAHVVRIKHRNHRLIFWNLNRETENFFVQNKKFDFNSAAEHMNTGKIHITPQMVKWMTRHLQDTVSFNQPVTGRRDSKKLAEENEGTQNFEEVYSANKSFSIEEAIILEKSIEKSIESVRDFLSELSPIEKDIFIKRTVPMSFEEIGEIYSVNRGRIRQIQHRALRKMRNYYVGNSDFLLEFLHETYEAYDTGPSPEERFLLLINLYTEFVFEKSFHEYFPLPIEISKETLDLFEKSVLTALSELSLWELDGWTAGFKTELKGINPRLFLYRNYTFLKKELLKQMVLARVRYQIMTSPGNSQSLSLFKNQVSSQSVLTAFFSEMIKMRSKNIRAHIKRLYGLKKEQLDSKKVYENPQALELVLRSAENYEL